MKKSILLLVFVVCAVGVFAQDRIDTLYYTKEWKYARNKFFADYYRVAYYPTDSLQFNQLRDYYMNGELQGEGCFIQIDSLDDSRTIFHGECIGYYRGGRINYIANYKKGKLDGEYRMYNEDGSIKQISHYLNGKLSGLHTEYINDDLSIEIEYFAGQPVTEYYEVVDTNGNRTKYLLADNTPLWESPYRSERKVDYHDGIPWQFYNKNGLMVALTCTKVKDYGRWHRIDIIIANNTLNPLNFDPDLSITAKSVDKDGFITGLEVWSSDDYIKKVNRSQTWAAVIMGVSEGMSTANAGYSTSTTNTFGFGGYSSTSYTRTYNASEAYTARAISQQRIDNFCSAMEQEQAIKKLGYLKKNTIYPGETISGYVHVQRVKSELVTFVINIYGAEYIFDWQTDK